MDRKFKINDRVKIAGETVTVRGVVYGLPNAARSEIEPTAVLVRDMDGNVWKVDAKVLEADE